MYVPDDEPAPAPAQQYALAAVVAHVGELDGGHYVAFVRLGGAWFKCDDAWVVRVHESAVRSCQAYLLYYASHDLTP